MSEMPTPFYGSSVGSEVPELFTVALDDIVLPVNLANYRNNGLSRLRSGAFTSEEPGDNLLNPEAGFWRYRYSWELGAGQRYDEIDRDSSPFRFAASENLDPFAVEGQLSLTRSSTEPGAPGVFGSNARMARTSQYLYVIDGTALYRMNAAGTWTTIPMQEFDGTAVPGTRAWITSDGDRVYFTAGQKVFFIENDASNPEPLSEPSPAPAYTASSITGLWYVANRLLLAVGGTLYEIKTNTTPSTQIFVHRNGRFKWTSVFALGSRIYVGGYAGTSTEIYVLTVTSAGELAVSNLATQFSIGEQLLCATVVSGIAVLGTNLGVRLAVASNDNELEYGPVITQGGACRALDGDGEYVYFARSVTPNLVANTIGIGRLRLSRFVGTLQAAWANDEIHAFQTGTATPANITSLMRFNNKTVVSALGRLQQTSTSYATNGWVESEQITMGTVEPKQFSELLVNHASLPTGCSITAQITNAATGVVVARQSNAVVGSTSFVVDLQQVNAESIVVRIELATSVVGATPIVTSWRLRAVVQPVPVNEWLVPLIASDTMLVGDGDGTVMTIDPMHVLDRIREMWATGRPVKYVEQGRTYNVRVDNYEAAASRWRDDGVGFQLEITVRLLTK